MSSEPSTSSDPSLLYSEFMNTDPVERIVEAVDKKKEKPEIKFTKSLVLARVIGLLSALKESEKELKKKPEKERNIEICEDGAPVVEMNVAILKESDDKSSTVVECADASSDSSDSDDSESDENIILPEYLSGIFEKDTSDSKIFKLVEAEPAVSESSNSPSKEEVCELSQDLKSENVAVKTALTNTELDQPPAKKICVM